MEKKKATCRSERRNVIAEAFTDEQIQAFLLGECEEQLAIRMEERLFADDGLLLTMQKVKARLLEAQAAERLTPTMSETLSLQIERSPRLKRELETVREKHSIRIAPAEAAARHWGWRWGLGSGLVGAAVMVPVIVTGLRRHERLVVRDVAHLSASAATPNATGGAATAWLAPATALFLPASVLRGNGAVRTLGTPNGSRSVELQVEIRGGADYGGMPASLLHNGREVSEKLTTVRRAEGSVRFLSVIVPAGVLTSGDYRLVIGRANDTRSFEREFRLR